MIRTYNTCEAVPLEAQVKQGGYHPRSSFPDIKIGDCERRVIKKGDKEVEILNVLRELFGEAVHIIALNASSLGALLSNLFDRSNSRK